MLHDQGYWSLSSTFELWNHLLNSGQKNKIKLKIKKVGEDGVIGEEKKKINMVRINSTDSSSFFAASSQLMGTAPPSPFRRLIELRWELSQ